MGNTNSKSVTYSVRVQHWLDVEVEKLTEPGETKADVVRRALLLLVTTRGSDDGS